MAKMFYSTEEACQKLQLSEDEIKQLVETGQLQEFRDRDQLMFKVDQVDLLASVDEDDSLNLADSAAGADISLTDSGEISLAADSSVGMSVEDVREQTGISIFEADELEEADPAAQTQITDAGEIDFQMESSTESGSGLLDMTQEADDTSLGVDLLDDVYSGDEEETVDQTTLDADTGSELFESTESDSEIDTAAAPAMMLAPPFDGPGSGLVGGLAFGIALVAIFCGTLVLMQMTGGGTELLDMVSKQFWAIVGALGGITLLAGLIGFVMLRKA